MGTLPRVAWGNRLNTSFEPFRFGLVDDLTKKHGVILEALNR